MKRYVATFASQGSKLEGKKKRMNFVLKLGFFSPSWVCSAKWLHSHNKTQQKLNLFPVMQLQQTFRYAVINSRPFKLFQAFI